MNLVSLLFRSVKKSPDKTAIIYKGKEISYSWLWRNIHAVLQRLKSMGFKKGDKIALFLPNSVEWVICFYAILTGGGVVIPLAAYLKQFELKSILGNCLPASVISTLDLWEKAAGGCVFPFNVNVISITQLFSDDIPDNDSVKDNIRENIRKNICEKIESCLPGSLASINYTYNGTGSPQGAEITHGNYLYGFNGLIRHLGLKREDVFFVPLPMAHIYSLALGVLVPLLSGAAMVIPDHYFPKTLFKLVENHKVTVFISVPSLFQLMNREMQRRKYTIPSLRLMVSGGEYMPPGLQLSIQDNFKVPIVQGYGLTECLPIICSVPGGPNNPKSLGIPGRKDILVKIVNSKMKEVAKGIEGEILIKSPTNMKRYHNSPQATNEVFYKGWLRTGDMGNLDDAGFLYFAGLKKKIYNLSGLKADPVELKLVGKLHPAVKEIKILDEASDGILSRKVLIAEVTIKDDAQVTGKDLEELYKNQIAGYKVPKRIIIKKKS